MTEHIRVFVEGETDEPFARRLVEVAGHAVTEVFPMRGHGEIDKRIARWTKPSNHHPVLVLRDLDPDLGTGCAPGLIRHLVGEGARSQTTIFRIAERELEGWMLADREGAAQYFAVDPAAIPMLPDEEPDPKRTLVDLCRSSTSKRIRSGMVPTSSSGRAVGRQFTGLVLEFGRSHWDPARARTISPSLDRALKAVERL